MSLHKRRRAWIVIEYVPATHAARWCSIQQNMVRKQLAEEINDIPCHSLIHFVLGEAGIVGVEVAVSDFRDAHGRFLAIVVNRQFANLRVA